MSSLQNEIFPHDLSVLPPGIQQDFDAIDFIRRCQKENSLYTSILDINFTNHNNNFYTSYFQMFTSMHDFMPSYWHILAPQLNIVGFEVKNKVQDIIIKNKIQSYYILFYIIQAPLASCSAHA